MNSKDLLNNSTQVAFIPTEELAADVESGAITDLLGIGRKILMTINAGTPAAGALNNVVVYESNMATFTDPVGDEVLDATGIDISQTTMTLHATDGVGYPLYDFDMILTSGEIVTVKERVGDLCYIKRAQRGTTATVHAGGATARLSQRVLHTFAEISAASLVEADLAAGSRYVGVVCTVTVDTFLTSVTGLIYLERDIPSGI